MGKKRYSTAKVVHDEAYYFSSPKSWKRGNRHMPDRVGLKRAMLREADVLDAMHRPGGDELRTAISLLTELSFDRIRDAI